MVRSFVLREWSGNIGAVVAPQEARRGWALPLLAKPDVCLSSYFAGWMERAVSVR